jgi:hypothetical protein
METESKKAGSTKAEGGARRDWQAPFLIKETTAKTETKASGLSEDNLPPAIGPVS